MAEMTTQELTTYLKYAAELEASVYRQEKALKQANKDLVMQTPRHEDIKEPKNSASGMQKPKEPEETNYKVWIVLLIWGLFQGGLGLLCLVLGVGAGLSLANIAFGGLITFLAFKVKKSAIKTTEKNKLAYEQQMQEYTEKVEQANKKYEKEMAKYRLAKEAENAAYQEKFTAAKKQFGEASEAVQLLNTPLEETKAALEQLYAADIIFPKYRDMVAMCSMYEYFASGRVTELTGPNGAYNLYEAELRQNLIINRLETIISQLEQIKQNQYMLYQEMKTTNSLLSSISADVKGILQNTKDIAAASAITAHCAQITAKNTEALKYITLING